MSDIVPFRHPEKRRDTTSYVGMLIFLGTWTMMFAALFFSYAEVRLKAASWPPPGESALPIGLPAFNTVLLILASIALGFGLRAVRGAQPLSLKRWLWIGLLLGVGFLGSQLYVWRALYLDGLRPSSGIYGSVFYALTCFHGLHVLVGLVGIALLLPAAHRGRYSVQNHAPVRIWTMYWHFVDLVWVLMFVTVYVL